MRVVVVTGANRGIGFSISSLLLKSAPDISVVLACRDTSKGEDARKKLQAEDDTFVSRTDVLEMDVSTETSVQRAAGLVKDKHGRWDDAGIAHIPVVLVLLFLLLLCPEQKCVTQHRYWIGPSLGLSESEARRRPEDAGMQLVRS
eukprot:3553625-Rhodomonas_salina.1